MRFFDFILLLSFSVCLDLDVVGIVRELAIGIKVLTDSLSRSAWASLVALEDVGGHTGDLTVHDLLETT